MTTLTKTPASTSLLARVPFIDHMRGFIFLLMAVDHSLHAYAANWGRHWFYRDYDRSYIFDALYLFNQAAIMPVLFFTFGAYVLPKITTLGWKGFWQDRFVKHILPFMVGIPLVVPLLSYPKFHEYENPGSTYLEFWQDIFFSQKLQAGPYWVMYAIILYTVVLLLFNKLFPKLIPWMAHHIKTALTSPMKAFTIFILFSMVVYGLSDLRWGAPWWIGFRNILPDALHGELFSLQASKFLMNFVYFVLGAAFMYSKAWEHPTNWVVFQNKRFLLLGLTLLTGLAYVLYSHFYFAEGAFDYSFYKALRQSGENTQAWSEAFALLPQVAPAILIRTSLLGALAFFQVIALVTFFSAKNTSTTQNPFWAKLWASAAACCWGIFIFHDPIVIWGQFFLTDFNLIIFFKFAIVATIGISSSWALTHFILKIKYIRAVFELD
ncbi:MAG TPA: hypothetical protein DD412_02265 [Holosporales bacterium]|nr:hypothetical protein [Holosporales bacterium]